MNNYYQNLVFNGLGTLSITMPFAGLFDFEGHIQLPRIASGSGQSSLLVVINQNGSPVYTGIAGADGFKKEINCAANDVIAIVFSSSAAADLPLNAIKSSVSVSVGE